MIAGLNCLVCMIALFVDWLFDLLFGWTIARLDGWLVVCPVELAVGSFVGCQIGQLVEQRVP